jgi:hypothetical protein
MDVDHVEKPLRNEHKTPLHGSMGRSGIIILVTIAIDLNWLIAHTSMFTSAKTEN